jgi:hypothetical protein
LLGVCACNSAPKETCTPYTQSVVAAGTPPASCDGTCASLPLADGGDAGFLFCTIECTDGGQPACGDSGTTCISAQSKGFNSDRSFCFFACGTDDAGNNLGSCLSPLFCYPEAGVCL